MKNHQELCLATLTLIMLLVVLLGHATTAGADQWDWRNDPERFGGTMVYELTQLPLEGQVETMPWPPAYVPQDAESIPVSMLDASDVYDAAFNGWSRDDGGDDDLQHSGPLFRHISEALDSCATHADLDTDGNGAIDEQEDIGHDEFYLLARDEQEDSGDDEHYFWGLCHSWVAAAIMEPQPHSPVLESDVEFSADELKSLLALEWTRASSRFSGGVCGLGDETLTVDEDGFIVEPECADTNPGAFHVLLTNVIGLEGRSFAVDHDMAAPVTMFPLESFEVLDLEEIGAGEANELLGIEGSAYPFNETAGSFAHVWIEVTSVDPAEGDYSRIDRYDYLLELDALGSIVGGKWLGDSRQRHPDFSWKPETSGASSDAFAPAGVEALVLRSQVVDQDGDGITDDVDICPAEDAWGRDADHDGCSDRVADLAGVVLSLALHSGTERSLVASAESAAGDKGVSAMNKLGAFVNKVQAQRGKKLTDDQANLLVSFAAHASAELQGD